MNNARTPQFYMANLGSEIVGMYSALSKNDTEKCRKCYDRAKKIIAEWRVLETRESARAEMKKLEEVVDEVDDVCYGCGDFLFGYLVFFFSSRRRHTR